MPPKGKNMAKEMSELKDKQDREIRELKERLVALETSKRRDEDKSDFDEEEEEEFEDVEEELDPEDQRMEKFLRAVKSEKNKVKIDVPNYGGNLNDEELLDWIAALDNYLECEDVPEEQMMKIVKTKLKGHALLWWDYEQSERRKKGKSKIVSWDKMVAKMKGKFLPKDYAIQMFRKLQGLKQKEMDVKTYTEEFYKLSIRSSHNENENEKIARYLGGLRFNI